MRDTEVGGTVQIGCLVSVVAAGWVCKLGKLFDNFPDAFIHSGEVELHVCAVSIREPKGS